MRLLDAHPHHHPVEAIKHLIESFITSNDITDVLQNQGPGLEAIELKVSMRSNIMQTLLILEMRSPRIDRKDPVLPATKRTNDS